MDPALRQELDEFLASQHQQVDNPINSHAKLAPYDLEVVSKFQQVMTDFNSSASSNLIRHIVRHQELYQTFDATTNYSLLNESKSSEQSDHLNGERERQVKVDASNETVAQAFGAIEQTLDKQKLAKFLEPKLQGYCKKMKQKINLKGLELDSILNNPDNE